MIKKILKSIKNIKVVHRFFISYSVLVLIVISSWVFSYTTTKQLENSLQELNNTVFPAFSAINDLKNQVNYNLFSVYDYISTDNSESLNNYYTSLDKITIEKNHVFQFVQPTKHDFFNEITAAQKIDNLNNATKEIIAFYQNDPGSPQLKEKILSLKNLRDNFTKLLENEIDINIQSKITDSQALISQKINQITIYLIIVVLLIVVVTILLLVFMYFNITTPVNKLTEAAIKFGRGELVKIDMDSEDELGILSHAFDKMAADISATQTALQDELAKTKEIDQQKSEFLSIAAHQLRTPMSGLKWLLNLVLSGDLGSLTEKQKHFLHNGQENVDRMIKLINDFLDIAKIEQAKFQYKFETIKIQDVIKEIVKMLETRIEAKQILLTVKEQKDTPQITVDKEKIKIAFMNLIDNAIKYSPAKSSIEINIAHENNQMKITISDHGYGIPAKDQKLIFTKFFRSSNIIKKETSLDSIGTGLGLYIVKDIIIKHHGQITFTSIENKGTTFFIELPL